MKNSISIFALFLFCVTADFTASAQGNLQFSKVVFISQDTTADIASNAPFVVVKTVTVPQGKVWKIESASARNTGQGSYPQLYLENTILYTFASNMPPFPIWLPTGNYQISIPGCSQCNLSYSWWLSAIEFNVVP